MAVKISSLRQLKRLPTWFPMNSLLSSLSCAMNYDTPKNSDQLQSNSSVFQASDKALYPENLVSHLEKTPDLSSSMKIFKWASLQKRFKHTPETYKMMILKLGMEGDVVAMEAFCSEMVRENFDDKNKFFSEYIDSFVCNGRFNEALRVLHVMISGGLKPSVESFNVLMSAVVEENRGLKDALFVYKEMVKAGVVPNIHTLNCLIDVLFETGRVDAAVDQYRRLGKKGCSPNSNTFRIVISRLAAMNRVQQSVAIMEEMFQCGCEVDGGFYTCLIPVFCSLGDLETGMKLFNRMKASNLAPDYGIYAAMIKYLCEDLRMSAAIKFLDEMLDSGLNPDYLLYLDVVTGFRKINKLDEAQNLLQQRNLMDVVSLHNAILSAYCDCSNLSSVEDKFEGMLECNVVDAVSWNIVIRFLCERSEIGKASEYLCRMIICSFVPDSATFSALILGYSLIGKIAAALGLHHHMRSKMWGLDHSPYAEFVNCLCRNGSVSDAAEVFCYMTDKGCALELASLGMLFEEICTIGEVNKAVEFLPLVRSVDTCSVFTAYNGILRGLSKSSKKGNHLLVILARTIVKGCNFEAETYHGLIKWMSSHGRGAESAYIFNTMIRDGVKPDSETLSCLLSCLCKYSQVHLILPYVSNLASGSEDLDQSTCKMLTYALWREGHKTEANQLLDLMLEKGWVPEASLHSLLMGSAAEMNVNRRIDDSIGCILEEGLQSA